MALSQVAMACLIIVIGMLYQEKYKNHVELVKEKNSFQIQSSGR